MGADHSVEIVVKSDDGELTSGVKRQMLVNEANGMYVAFIDDDDMVAEDYVKTILAACEATPDVVTFNLELTRTDRSGREVWRYHLGEDQRRFGNMTANHLCAWRKDLATLVGWCPYLGYGDDQLWYKPLLASGKAVTEFHINRVMYHYQYSHTETCNQRPRVVHDSLDYIRGGLECYWLQDTIAIEHGTFRSRKPNHKWIVNNLGQSQEVHQSQLQLIELVRVN